MKYTGELETSFRNLRISVLEELFKEATALTEPLDKLVKNGKYLTDTQLKYVLSHLGLSSLMADRAAIETQKLEFLREFIPEG